MSLLFVIPGALRQYAANRSEVRIDDAATSVSDALSLLWRECPGVRDRVVTERSEVRPHVNIFVNGESIRYSGGLNTPIRDGAEIVILAAVSGG